MIYLIPKNIKVKREIFKGFGIFELIVLAISLGLGFLFQSLAKGFQMKVFLFCVFPLTVFLMFLPLPNGSTALIIFKKFLIFSKKQRKYKFK